MIEAEHLTKDYGGLLAVSDLSFRVGKGEVVGFLGPNGAGKTTTLRILAGFLGATAGRVSINGFDIVQQSLQARRCIGYMPEATPLYPELRVREYLEFRAAIKRVPRRRRAEAIQRVLGLAALTDVADTLVLHLSKGYRQRVGLADALVARPPLLILDEPTIGLDPNQIRDVRRLIRELGEEHTILLSTHILSEVESTCDRAMVIDRGRLVASGTIAELRALRRSEPVRMLVRDPQGQAQSLLERTAGVQRVSCAAAARGQDGLLALTVTIVPDVTDRAVVVERMVSSLVTAGLAVREVGQARATLEEVFAQLTHAGGPESDNSGEAAS
jgi:ABC-2 type transport system ATP-binding protein